MHRVIHSLVRPVLSLPLSLPPSLPVSRTPSFSYPFFLVHLLSRIPTLLVWTGGDGTSLRGAHASGFFSTSVERRFDAVATLG